MKASSRFFRRPTWIQTIAICLIVAAVCTLVTSSVLKSRYEAELGIYGNYSKLEEIRRLVKEYYVGEYTDEELMDMLAIGYMNGINDKWAYYTSAENLRSLYDQKRGSYAGVGITVSPDPETGMLSVLEVYEGSPAETAGIKVLDKLYAVEGQLVSELGLEATAAMVRGESGTSVHLTIWREGILHEYNIVRRTVEKQSVTSELINGEIGYIRISQFTEAAAGQFKEKLESLIDINAKSLIVDVRNNPGGMLPTLLSVLDRLMPKGTLFVERNKKGEEKKYSSDNEYCDLPLVVLANEYSYSAAEYFAAITQEQGRAYIIGRPTTGKGEAQQTFELSDGSAVTFSTIKYFTPNGVSISEKGGIKPDLDMEISPEKTAQIGTLEYSEDPHIMAAIEYLGNIR